MGITSGGVVPNDGSEASATFKSFSYTSRAGASGISFLGGFYDYPVADANLTNAAPTQTHGVGNVPYAAQAFVVAAGAGSTDGSDLVLTVSGTSITDAGVRAAGASEVIVAAATAAAANQYFQTTKKWLGTVTFTLTSTTGTVFSFDFNYGYCRYEDFGGRAFTLSEFDAVGECNATDTGFDLELLVHKPTGWTYSAAAFVAGNAAVAKMSTVHGAESDPTAAEFFSFKRSALGQAVAGQGGQGVLVRVTTAVNAAINFMDCHIGVRL